MAGRSRWQAWGLGAALTLLLVAVGWWRAHPGTSSQAPPLAEARDAPLELDASRRDEPPEPPESVTGLVEDEQHAPLDGVRVRLLAQRSPLLTEKCPVCGQPRLECEDPATLLALLEDLRRGVPPPPKVLEETRTDAQGHFTFELLADRRSGARVAADRGGWEDDDWARPSELVLTLREAAPRTVRIVVEDGPGSPVPGARVTTWSTVTGEVREVVAGADGAVALPPLGASIVVFVDAPGFLPRVRLLERGEDELELAPSRALLVKTTRGGEAVEAEVTLTGCGHPRRARTEEGQARFDDLGPRCAVEARAEGLTSGDRPVRLSSPLTELTLELAPAARLVITLVSEPPLSARHVRGALRGVPVAAPPRHSLREVLPGRAPPASVISGTPRGDRQLVFGPVPAGAWALTLEGPALRDVRRVVELAPGENTLELALEPPRQARGVVLDSVGRPVSGAFVLVQSTSPSPAHATTDERGRFAVTLEGAGPWLVRAEHETEGQGEAPVPSDLREVVLRLRGGAKLQLTVFDVDGRSVEPHAELRGGQGRRARDVPPSGLLSGVEAGAWTLSVDEEGRVPIVQPVTLVEGQLTRVDVHLERAVEVSGRVLDADGTAVEGATVAVTSDPGGEELTAEGGAFTLGGLRAGELELVAKVDESGQVGRKRVRAPAKGVVLVLPAAPMVSGRVVDEAGRPVRRFEVGAREFDTADGRFSVPVGDGELTFFAASFLERVLTSVVAGSLGDVVLRRAHPVEGVVVDASGEPVDGAIVADANDLEQVAWTGEDGRFQLKLASPTPTTLVATAFGLRAEGPSGPGAVRLVLQAGARVRGLVRGRDGAPRPAVELEARRAGTGALRATTGDDGRFVLQLQPGPWRLRALGSATELTVNVVEGPNEVELVLEPSGACGFVAEVAAGVRDAWLVPGTGASLLPVDLVLSGPGVIHLAHRAWDRTVLAEGVPCGDGVLVVLPEDLFSGMQRFPVSLHEPLQLFSF